MQHSDKSNDFNPMIFDATKKYGICKQINTFFIHIMSYTYF